MKDDKAQGGSTPMILDFLSHYLETILVAAGTIGLYVSLAFFGQGGLVGTDILAYMNIALNSIKSTATSYDRYFYLLLERIFLKIAPTPLLGAQWYWAFLIAATCLLVYLCGRLFSPASRPLYGLLAVATFLSIGYIANTNGSPGVDLAAMGMVAGLILIYLFSARRNHRSRWLIALFGFFLYLAFRTKETCLPAGILVCGFGFTEQDQFNGLAFAKNLLIVLGGFLVGAVFFAICMLIFVGDPFFGLRLSEFRDYLASYAIPEEVGSQQQNSLANWFNGYFFDALLVPFVLYILSGLKTSHLNGTRRWVWTLPLTIILFVTVTIGNRWGIVGRFVLPAIPAICLLWPQSLDLHFPRDQRNRNSAGLLICGGLVAIFGIRLLMRVILPKLGWDTLTFLNVVLYPILLVGILGIYFIFTKPGLKSSIILSLLVLALLVSPIISNFNAVFINGYNQTTAQEIFYPFSSFSKQIVFTSQMRMYISTDTWHAVGNPYYTKSTDKVLDIFNDYFDAASTRVNFSYTSFKLDDAAALLSSQYTYILLSRADWRILANDPSAVSLVKQNYQVFFDPKMILVLLKAR
jgi:hypothetical protein